MKTLVAHALLGAAVLAALPRSADETMEPPPIYALEVGGKRVALEPDLPLDLDTPDARTRVVLRTEPHRVFPFAGLRFHYPRGMGFEADMDTPGVALWSLDGNDAVVMVQRYGGREVPGEVREEVVTSIQAQFGRRSATSAPSKTSLGGRELEGTEIRIAIAGTRLIQEVYAIPSGRDTIILIVQDSLEDDGSHSAEYGTTKKMLAESFRFPGE